LLRTGFGIGCERTIRMDPNTSKDIPLTLAFYHETIEPRFIKLEGLISSMQDLMTDRFDFLFKKYEVFSDELTVISHQLKRIDHRLDKLESRMENMESRMENIESGMDHHDQEYLKIHYRLNGLEAEVREVKNQLMEKKKPGVKGGPSNQEIQSELTRLRWEMAHLTQRMDSLEKQYK